MGSLVKRCSGGGELVGCSGGSFTEKTTKRSGGAPVLWWEALVKSCGGKDHTEKKKMRTGYCSFAKVDDNSAQRGMIACWSFTEYDD